MGNIRTCRTNGFNILKERLLVLGENYKKLLVKYNCYGLGGPQIRNNENERVLMLVNHVSTRGAYTY